MKKFKLRAVNTNIASVLPIGGSSWTEQAKAALSLESYKYWPEQHTAILGFRIVCL